MLCLRSLKKKVLKWRKKSGEKVADQDTWIPSGSPQCGFSHLFKVHIQARGHLFSVVLSWVIGGPGEGWEVRFSSVVLHPAVLLDKGVDHFLHGQVRDQLVLGQRTPGDRVKMAHSLCGEHVRALTIYTTYEEVIGGITSTGFRLSPVSHVHVSGGL